MNELNKVEVMMYLGYDPATRRRIITRPPHPNQKNKKKKKKKKKKKNKIKK